MTERCRHCGEPAGPSPIRVATDGGAALFCCAGCHAAWTWITAAGLARYYRQREAGQPVSVDTERFSDFALPDVAAHYVAEADDGSATVSLHIGGMRCAACVWLLEKVAEQTAGVLSCDVSFATHRAIVRFDPTTIDLAGVLHALARPGFQPEPVVPGELSNAQTNERRHALRRLAVAALFGMQTMMLAFALYLGDAYGMTDATRTLLEFASMVCTLPVIAYAGAPFFRGAWRGLVERQPGMDLPVALALTVAFTTSVLATFSIGTTVYYDSVAMFVLLLTGSRFLELAARHRAEDGVAALARMLPDAVDRLNPDGSVERIARRELRSGDRIRVRTGDTLPVDGRIVSGQLGVDEALLSGESRPLPRSVGESVCAGAGVAAGSATLVVERTGASTTLAEVGRLLERAGHQRATTRAFADRLASVFVVAVVLVAALAATVWSQIDAARIVPVTLAVLIVACPCALALATPTALSAAATRLARDGLLLSGAGLLERFRPGMTLLTDKTGTLTNGRPVLSATHALAGVSATHCRAIAAALEAESEHPLARAFVPFAAGVSLDAPADVRVGEGVCGTIDGVEYRLGRASFVAAIAGCEPAQTANAESRVYLGRANEWLASFDVCDALRADAPASVAALRQAGIKVVIASGDSPTAVAVAARELGVHDWHANLSPANKLELLANLHAAGESVVMLGDGVNDAPVLAAADASIAMGGGTALARANADAILVGDTLTPLATLADVSRRTRWIVRQSAAWAIAYNGLAVTAAALGLITPWMAAIGMSASSLLVVSNALRLRRATADRSSELTVLAERTV
ncbi:MAG: heavy metal translocating P-type ATPase [Pseudomonadota bacterium]